jgi:hypothetical protein
MPKTRTKLFVAAKPWGMLVGALALPLAISTVPAQAEGLLSGFFRAFSQPAAPAPPPTFEYQPDPFADQVQHKARPRPKPVAVEQPEVKKPVEPRRPGEMDNPFPALLADSTLQPGDMVMFPDGLRVFVGRSGGQHKLADFKPLAQAGKALPRSVRKLVADLLPSQNPAWSAEGLKSGGKLAANTKDVETTGSVKRARR